MSYVARTTVPEFFLYDLEMTPLWVRCLIMVLNLAWIIMVFIDIWKASVAYDAADSLLGDGFPTLMRGANANAANADTSDQIAALREEMAALLKSNKQ